VHELYSQGKSQLEIEEILGIPQQTISLWLNENNYQIIINPSTGVDHFSVKSKDLLIYTEDGKLDEKFLELLNGKLEEGVKVHEFLAEYGKAFRAEDVKRFREWNRRIAWCSTAHNLPWVKGK
jgi:transcriptional regulator with XRE-family HTH domain